MFEMALMTISGDNNVSFVCSSPGGIQIGFLTFMRGRNGPPSRPSAARPAIAP
jgi:hypothetical protein